jgi:hypothetical protein
MIEKAQLNPAKPCPQNVAKQDNHTSAQPEVWSGFKRGCETAPKPSSFRPSETKQNRAETGLKPRETMPKPFLVSRCETTETVPYGEGATVSPPRARGFRTTRAGAKTAPLALRSLRGFDRRSTTEPPHPRPLAR